MEMPEEEKLLNDIFGDRPLPHVTVEELLNELNKVRDKKKHVLINKTDRIAETHEAWTVCHMTNRSGYFDIGLGDPTTNFSTSPEHNEKKRRLAQKERHEIS
jgi:hypothetical protein